MGLTFDAGGLIAIEKGSREIMVLVKAAALNRQAVTVPSVVLAQVWRGNNARVALALKNCVPDTLDWAGGKSAGALLAKAGTSDVVDAAVVVSAQKRGDVIVTSDPHDIERLIEVSGSDLKLRVV
jgi:hypothetical protein